jgi:Dyp-type peroxidase family
VSWSRSGSLREVDLGEVQGIVVRGHAHLPCSSILFLALAAADTPPALVELRQWIADLVPEVTTARARRPPTCLQIALTAAGLKLLGVTDQDTFLQEFREGMAARYRALGDPIDVSGWKCGSAAKPVHAALLLYAFSPAALGRLVSGQISALPPGCQVVHRLDTGLRQGGTEPFGFRDGISQPTLLGSRRKQNAFEPAVRVGEFILGYENEYGQRSFSPAVDTRSDASNVLPEHPLGAGWRDLGKSGSYVVIRQLEQDVPGFTATIADSARALAVNSEWLAGQIMGRRRDGKALASPPGSAGINAFGYAADPQGTRCPFGAHIRRANPRDARPGALREVQRHRLLRRGRPYRDGQKEGLAFVALAADLGRQFEFIQQIWLNRAPMGASADGRDVIAGGADSGPGDMLVAREPSRLQLRELPAFVAVRGGDYFFLPSISALVYLARLGNPAAPVERLPEADLAAGERVATLLQETLRVKYPPGGTLRDAHPKQHGCVRATFIVSGDLPPELQAGLFAHAGEYKAWVRFSNQDMKAGSDSAPDVRGAAIKILDVKGSKILPGHEQDCTHDFVLITGERFLVGSLGEFERMIRAYLGGRLRFWAYLATHWSVSARMLQQFRRTGSLLDTTYTTLVPQLYGAGKAARFRLRPQVHSAACAGSGRDFLMEELWQRLSAEAVSFDFLVQLGVGEERTPINDPTVAWSEDATPFRRVAILRLEQQRRDSEEQRLLDRGLAFNPWRCLAAHRPLGAINHARRSIYARLAAFRRIRNGLPTDGSETEETLPVIW